jgi:hypothetical protein
MRCVVYGCARSGSSSGSDRRDSGSEWQVGRRDPSLNLPLPLRFPHRYAIAEMLLHKHAKPDTRDSNGSTALHYAAR